MRTRAIEFLKQINSMPISFGMRHYQIFGDSSVALKDKALVSPESWDELRDNHPFFSIAADREGWLAASELEVFKDGQDAGLKDRAREIAEFLKQEEIIKIFSVGVGGAALEYQLKKLLPSLTVICSDYSKTTVERLQRVFTESDEIIQFDIQNGDWKEVTQKYLGNNSLVLIYRIDASFSDDDWRAIFSRMANNGVSSILVIPTGVLTIVSIYNRKKRELKWFLTRTKTIFCGYLRTKARFQQQWRGLYKEKGFVFGGLKSFYLENLSK
jgi:hypothetical protein